jgi:hypothetical protein
VINLVSKQPFKLVDVGSFARFDLYKKVELHHPFNYLWRLLISVLTATFFASSGFAQTVTTRSVCFDNQSNVDTPTIYYWNPGPNPGALAAVNWPGLAMQQTGAFYGHEFGADFDSLNVIFNDSGAQQTETLELLGNKRRRANNQWQRHAINRRYKWRFNHSLF